MNAGVPAIIAKQRKQPFEITSKVVGLLLSPPQAFALIFAVTFRRRRCPAPIFAAARFLNSDAPGKKQKDFSSLLMLSSPSLFISNNNFTLHGLF
jgi:hypothetical protein